MGLLGRFTVTFAASSFAVFGVAGAIGLAVGRVTPRAAELAAIGAVLTAALALDAYSLRRKTWCPITLRRQAPKRVLYDFGARRAALAWGLDTGLVFTTYRMTSISWALLVLGVLGAAPWWVGIGYAAGFLIPLTTGCSIGLVWSSESATTAAPLMLQARPSIARLTSTTAIAVTLIAVVVTVR